MPYIQPELHVYRTLKRYNNLLKRAFSDSSINRLLSNIYGDLPSRQKKQIKDWLSRNSFNVFYGYPLDHEKLPSISVVVDSEEQTQQYMGDFFALGPNNARIEADRWKSQILIFCHAENMDLTRWMYHFVKYAIFADRLRLCSVFQHLQMSEGKDLLPERFGDGGRVRYGRALCFSVEYDQTAYEKYRNAPNWDDNNLADDDSVYELEYPDNNDDDDGFLSSEEFEIIDYATIGKPC